MGTGPLLPSSGPDLDHQVGGKYLYLLSHLILLVLKHNFYNMKEAIEGLKISEMGHDD